MAKKPEKVVADLCRGYKIGDTKSSYTRRDVLLYALGVGVSQDPLDPKDLNFTYENAENFSCLPSYAVCLSSFEDLFAALNECPGLPNFNPMMLLHGEEKVVVHKPLQTEATLIHTASIKDIYDKGKGALIVAKVESRDAASNEVVCVIEHSLFIRGLGGFGGDKGPNPPVYKPPKDRKPDAVFTKKTTPNQALIYRLSGDMNPLHADPNMAAMGGFDKPILHGLCFFGIATHGVIRELCDNDASKVLSIEGRFASPVLPGHTLSVQMWRDGKGKIIFQVYNEDTKQVSLANGCIFLRDGAGAKL